MARRVFASAMLAASLTLCWMPASAQQEQGQVRSGTWQFEQASDPITAASSVMASTIMICSQEANCDPTWFSVPVAYVGLGCSISRNGPGPGKLVIQLPLRDEGVFARFIEVIDSSRRTVSIRIEEARETVSGISYLLNEAEATKVANLATGSTFLAFRVDPNRRGGDTARFIVGTEGARDAIVRVGQACLLSR
jgi:hypothetical protein